MLGGRFELKLTYLNCVFLNLIDFLSLYPRFKPWAITSFSFGLLVFWSIGLSSPTFVFPKPLPHFKPHTMQELIERLKAEAGLTDEQAKKAIETIKNFVVEKFPMLEGAVSNVFGN